MCKLSEHNCKYGGNKYYNFGFVQGVASYCRYAKRWVADLNNKCPLQHRHLTTVAPDQNKQKGENFE